MKSAIMLILAVACLALASALVWTPGGRSDVHARHVVTSEFSPAILSDDVAILDRRVGDLRLNSVPLGDAIRALADRVHVKIAVDWNSLASVNADSARQVTINLNDANLAEALDAVLTLFPPAPNERVSALGFYVSSGSITLTTAVEAAAHPLTAYINIRPLVEELLAYWDRRLLEKVRSGDADNARFLHNRQDVIQDVCSLIMNSIAMGSWNDTGGTVGMMREAGGVLIISHTPKYIFEIRTMLERMHQAMREDLPLSKGPDVSAQIIPAGADPKTGAPLFTEFINIRSLEVELGSGKISADDVRSPDAMLSEDISAQVQDLVIHTIAPRSWKMVDDRPTNIHIVGGVLIVTQTAENLAALHDLLLRLHVSAINGEPFPTRQRSQAIPATVTSPSEIAPATQPAAR